MLVGVIDILIGALEFAPGQCVALDVVYASLFDFALVARRLGNTRRYQEVVVLRELPIAALCLLVMHNSPYDRGFEIVRPDLLDHSTKELEASDVKRNPRLDLLVKDDLGVLVAAPRKRHHEDPCPANPLLPGVIYFPGVPEVDLCLLPNRRLHTNERFRLSLLQPTHEAFDRVVTSCELVLLLE